MSTYRIFKYVMHEAGRNVRSGWTKLSRKAKTETLKLYGVAEDVLESRIRVIEKGSLFEAGWLINVIASTPEELEKLIVPAAMELMDIDAGGVTVFAEDSELVEDIYKTKLRMDALGPSMWPAFSFAPQVGLRIDDVEIRPFIFVDAPLRPLCEKIFHMGSGGLAKPGPLPEQYQEDERIVRVLIAGNDPCRWDACWGGPSEEVLAVLRGKKEVDRDIRIHMSLALKLMAFSEVFPGRVEVGLPGEIDKRAFDCFATGEKKKQRKSLVLRVPRDSYGVREHLRSGTWVKWTHPDKCVRSGGKPWTSYRKGTTVKRKTTPYTITKKSAQRSRQ